MSSLIERKMLARSAFLAPVLRKIIYSSRAAAPLGENDLYAILRAARANNAAHKITGLLLFINRLFLQVLEGESDAVGEVFERIASDARHSDVRVLRDAAINTRRFPDWSMGFEQVDDAALRAAFRDQDDDGGWHDILSTNLILNSAAAETLLQFYAPDIKVN